MVRCCVRLSSVVGNVCIMAKRYALPKKRLKKQTGLPDQVACGTNSDPLRPPLPQNGGNDCAQNTCIASCGQTASVSGIVTTDSLLELTNALSNGTIADPIWTAVLPNYGSLLQNLHYGQTVSIKWSLITCYRQLLSNASIADPPLPHQTGVLTPPKILGLQIAAKPLQIATWSLLTAYRN